MARSTGSSLPRAANSSNRSMGKTGKANQIRPNQSGIALKAGTDFRIATHQYCSSSTVYELPFFDRGHYVQLEHVFGRNRRRIAIKDDEVR